MCSNHATIDAIVNQGCLQAAHRHYRAKIPTSRPLFLTSQVFLLPKRCVNVYQIYNQKKVLVTVN